MPRVLCNETSFLFALGFPGWCRGYCVLRIKNTRKYDKIEDDFINNLETITRQALSKQRVFINPLVFKEISKEYLRLIGYNRNNNFFKEYKGFRLYGGDGSDFEIPDFEEVRRDFGIKDTPKYRKPAMAKFSSIMDLLNGFILDGIIGNYKQAELPLHRKLQTSRITTYAPKS